MCCTQFLSCRQRYRNDQFNFHFFQIHFNYSIYWNLFENRLHAISWSVYIVQSSHDITKCCIRYAQWWAFSIHSHLNDLLANRDIEKNKYNFQFGRKMHDILLLGDTTTRTYLGCSALPNINSSTRLYTTGRLCLCNDFQFQKQIDDEKNGAKRERIERRIAFDLAINRMLSFCVSRQHGKCCLQIIFTYKYKHHMHTV